MTAAAEKESWRGIHIEYPPCKNQEYGTGGGYHVGWMDIEESTSNSIEWSGEETEELASEKESKTAGGAGEVRTTPTDTAVESEVSGADNNPEDATAGRGATLDATPEDVDAAGSGGCHGAGKRYRERVAGQRENPAGESSGVVEGEGRARPLEWRKTPWESPGSGRGSRVSEGHRHPRSEIVAPGGQNLQSDLRGRPSAGGGWTGAGRGRILLSHPGHRGEHRNLPQIGDGEQDGAGGTANYTTGNGRGRD